MNLTIRISSLAAGLIAASDGPARPMPGGQLRARANLDPVIKVRP